MNIAIIFGGVSYEHEISIVSAITLKNILTDSLNLSFIFIDKERDLYLIPEDKMISSYFSEGDYQKATKLGFVKGGFETKSLFSKKLTFEAVLNLVHGGTGEDGTLASLLDFFEIKYIGPRKEASVSSFNKYFTKIYAESVDVKTLDFEILKIGEERKLKKMTYPVIVKPVTLGSSIGIHIAKNAEELNYALDTAFEFDDTVIIESFKTGVKEYNLAGALTDKFELSIIEEPAKKEFLDFEKKYLDFSREERVIKAELPKEIDYQFDCCFFKRRKV